MTNKGRMLSLAGSLIAASLLVAAPVKALEFGDWDADDNAELSAEEFTAGFGENGVYDEWDADDDGLLSEDEFNDGIFEGYDDDDDGVIEEPEIRRLRR